MRSSSSARPFHNIRPPSRDSDRASIEYPENAFREETQFTFSMQENVKYVGRSPVKVVSHRRATSQAPSSPRKKDAEHLSEELVALKKKYQEVLTRNKLLQSQNQRLESMLDKKDRSIQDILSYQADRSGDPSGQLTAALGSQQLMANITKRFREIEKEKKQIETELETLKKTLKYAKWEELQDELAKYRSEVPSLRAQLSTVTAQLQEKKSAELEHLNQGLASAKQQNKMLRRECALALQDLEQEREEKDGLRSALSVMRKREDEWLRDRESLITDLKRETARSRLLDVKEHELHSKSDELQRLQRANDGQRQEMLELHAERQRLVDDVQKLRTELQQARNDTSKSKEVQQQLQTLSDDVARYLGENTQLRKQVKDLQGEVSKLKGDVAGAKQENVGLQSKLAEKTERIKQLKVEFLEKDEKMQDELKTLELSLKGLNLKRHENIVSADTLQSSDSEEVSTKRASKSASPKHAKGEAEGVVIAAAPPASAKMMSPKHASSATVPSSQLSEPGSPPKRKDDVAEVKSSQSKPLDDAKSKKSDAAPTTPKVSASPPQKRTSLTKDASLPAIHSPSNARDTSLPAIHSPTNASSPKKVPSPINTSSPNKSPSPALKAKSPKMSKSSSKQSLAKSPSAVSIDNKAAAGAGGTTGGGGVGVVGANKPGPVEKTQKADAGEEHDYDEDFEN